MKRAFVLSVVAVAVLAGCGTDTCTSNPGTPVSTNPTCTVAPGLTTFNVQLCSKCNDSSPSCQAEILGNTIEVAPAVQQCQGDAGCASTGCANLRASCTLSIPPASSAYQLVIVGDQAQPSGTLTVQSGSSSNCNI